MKQTICIALSVLALCAIPFHISAEEAGQTLPELSADPTAAEAETEPVQTDAPLTDLTDEPVVPIVTDFPYDPAFSMPETEYIPVEGIELAEFKDKMYVKETQNLSATVSRNRQPNPAPPKNKMSRDQPRLKSRIRFITMNYCA